MTDWMIMPECGSADEPNWRNFYVIWSLRECAPQMRGREAAVWKLLANRRVPMPDTEIARLFRIADDEGSSSPELAGGWSTRISVKIDPNAVRSDMTMGLLRREDLRRYCDLALSFTWTRRRRLRRRIGMMMLLDLDYPSGKGEQ